MKKYQLIHCLNDSQIKDLHSLYEQEWWTKGRELDGVKKMLFHSDLIFGFCEPSTLKLISFARILTDFVYKALIFDFIVSSDYRNQDLGNKMMSEILKHSQLKSIQHFELYCLSNRTSFYERLGFIQNTNGLILMRRELE
jgi:predicted GNAT family N-acyltransferase